MNRHLSRTQTRQYNTELMKILTFLKSEIAKKNKQ